MNILAILIQRCGFPGGLVVKNPPANAADAGSIPGSGRSLGGGNGNPLQYSCLDNPMGRGAWWATVHGIAKGQTQLSEHTHTPPAVYCGLWKSQSYPPPKKKEGGEHLNKGGRIVLLSILLRPGLWRTVSSYWSRICREKELRWFFFQQWLMEAEYLSSNNWWTVTQKKH